MHSDLLSSARSPVQNFKLNSTCKVRLAPDVPDRLVLLNCYRHDSASEHDSGGHDGQGERAGPPGASVPLIHQPAGVKGWKHTPQKLKMMFAVYTLLLESECFVCFLPVCVSNFDLMVHSFTCLLYIIVVICMSLLV